MTISQRDAVFNAVKSVIGRDFQEGMNCQEFLSSRPDHKKEIYTLLFQGFERGEWEIKSSNVKNIQNYITGLVSNHLKKDLALNGGSKYVPTNPGTRTGVRDPEIKAMRGLLATLAEGTPAHADVAAAIEAKTAAYQAERAKTALDLENLPEEFMKYVK